jgi:hypothetical protein
MPCSPLQDSAEFHQVLQQKSARLSAHNVKRYAALVEPSELNWGEPKLIRQSGNRCAGIRVITRHEHALPLSPRWSARQILYQFE